MNTLSKKFNGKSACETTEKHYALLRSLESKKAEIVARTPFDNFEDRIALEVIDKLLLSFINCSQTELPVLNFVKSWSRNLN